LAEGAIVAFESAGFTIDDPEFRAARGHLEMAKKYSEKRAYFEKMRADSLRRRNLGNVSVRVASSATAKQIEQELEALVRKDGLVRSTEQSHIHW
jgi:hypothetical protein